MCRCTIHLNDAAGRRIGEIFSSLTQTRLNWIFVNIAHVIGIITSIFDTAFCKPALPYINFGSEAKQESSLNKLHCLFNRDFRRWRDDQMNMIRHKHKGVELISVFSAVFEKRIKKQVSIRANLKKSATVCSYSSRKKGSEFLRSEEHWLEPNPKSAIFEDYVRSGNPGPEGPSFAAHIPRPEGRGFHLIITAPTDLCPTLLMKGRSESQLDGSGWLYRLLAFLIPRYPCLNPKNHIHLYFARDVACVSLLPASHSPKES